MPRLNANIEYKISATLPSLINLSPGQSISISLPPSKLESARTIWTRHLNILGLKSEFKTRIDYQTSSLVIQKLATQLDLQSIIRAASSSPQSPISTESILLQSTLPSPSQLYEGFMANQNIGDDTPPMSAKRVYLNLIESYNLSDTDALALLTEAGIDTDLLIQPDNHCPKPTPFEAIVGPLSTPIQYREPEEGEYEAHLAQQATKVRPLGLPPDHDPNQPLTEIMNPPELEEE